MSLHASRRLAALAAGLAALVTLLALVPAGQARTTTCPPNFHVLHDDRIGALQVPRGYYQLAATGISCDEASTLFTTFLDDWDGKLPRPYRTIVQGRGRARFTGYAGQSFTVRLGGSKPTGGGGGGGGQHPASGLVCSSTFRLTQRDRVGALVLKPGRYYIDRLSARSPSCTQAAVLLGQFLQDFDGKLPNGWVVLPEDGTFLRGSTTYGFRLEPGASGGGGHSFPGRTTRCPATFRVVHADHVGALRFPAGPYWVNIVRGSNITCPESTRLFASFLARPNGDLPRPWVVDTHTGGFRRGRKSAFGFVTKPAFRVR